MAQTACPVTHAAATPSAATSDWRVSERLQHILHWFAHLTPQTLEDIGAIYAADCRFRDPFNDVRGLELAKAVYAHMFATTGEPRFIIERVVEQDRSAAVYWEFRCRVGGRQVAVHGMTDMQLNEAGLISQHLDYWDSADLFMHFPLLRQMLGWLKRRLALPH